MQTVGKMLWAIEIASQYTAVLVSLKPVFDIRNHHSNGIDRLT